MAVNPSSSKDAARKRLNVLVDILPKIKDLKTTPFTVKMWIDPTGRVIPLLTYHYEYFRDNPDEAAKYGIIYGEEIPTRLAALRKGFIRVNYERKNGKLTIESGAMGWTPAAIEVVFMLIAVNLEEIDCLRISVLTETGDVIESEESLMFIYSAQEKLQHVPLISLTEQGRQLIELLDESNE